MARQLVQPTMGEMQLRDVMRALSEDVRLQLIGTLADGQYHSCRPEEFEVGVHKSTLSHHFRVLRQAGITTTRLDGRNHYVRLRREDLDRRFPGLLDAVLPELRTEVHLGSPVTGLTRLPVGVAAAG